MLRHRIREQRTGPVGTSGSILVFFVRFLTPRRGNPETSTNYLSGFFFLSGMFVPSLK